MGTRISPHPLPLSHPLANERRERGEIPTLTILPAAPGFSVYADAAGWNVAAQFTVIIGAVVPRIVKVK
jgi:hypothetical protein